MLTVPLQELTNRQQHFDMASIAASPAAALSHTFTDAASPDTK